MKVFSRLLVFSLLLFNFASATELNENVTLSLAEVDDGIAEMLQDTAGDDGDEDSQLRGGNTKGLAPLYYKWRRLANTYKSGHSGVCDKCNRHETCNSEDGYTANLLEKWLRQNKGYVCSCSTYKSTAVGTPGYVRRCRNCATGCDCTCECTSYCDYKMKCSCL